LNGVNIQVKGSSVFTTSKQDGTFSIVAPDAKSVLVFTYVGFESKEVPVTGRTQIDILACSRWKFIGRMLCGSRLWITEEK
jgi:hypothetical protein